MYLDESEISRPAVPDDVDTIVGIMSHYSYLFLSSNTHIACARMHAGAWHALGCAGVALSSELAALAVS